MSNYPQYDMSPTPELQAWMDRNRSRRLLASLGDRLERARRRGSKRTLISLGDLSQVLDLLHNGITPVTKSQEKP